MYLSSLQNLEKQFVNQEKWQLKMETVFGQKPLQNQYGFQILIWMNTSSNFLLQRLDISVFRVLKES